MGEFATAVKYRLPIKVVIIKNNTPRHDQMGTDGVPWQPRITACHLNPIDFAAVARACGVAGYALSDPAQCAAVLRERTGRRRARP